MEVTKDGAKGLNAAELKKLRGFSTNDQKITNEEAVEAEALLNKEARANDAFSMGGEKGIAGILEDILSLLMEKVK
jgi:hypothetical protein